MYETEYLVWSLILTLNNKGKRMNDKYLRSLAKSLSYRICGTIVTSTLVFLFTEKWFLSLTVGAAEFFLKIVFFYIHERVWCMVKWGKGYP